MWRNNLGLSGGRVARSLIVSVLAVSLLMVAPAVSAAKKLASHVDLKAFVADDFTCSDKVKVWVLAPSRDAFRGDRVRLQRLSGAVRAALGFQCEGVEDIALVGQVDGKVVWRGVLSRKSGWVVVDLDAGGDEGVREPETEQAENDPEPELEGFASAGTSEAPEQTDETVGQAGRADDPPVGELVVSGVRGPVEYGLLMEDEAVLNVFP